MNHIRVTFWPWASLLTYYSLPYTRRPKMKLTNGLRVGSHSCPLVPPQRTRNHRSKIFLQIISPLLFHRSQRPSSVTLTLDSQTKRITRLAKRRLNPTFRNHQSDAYLQAQGQTQLSSEFLGKLTKRNVGHNHSKCHTGASQNKSQPIDLSWWIPNVWANNYVFLYTLHSFHNNYLNLGLSSSSAPVSRQLVWIA